MGYSPEKIKNSDLKQLILDEIKLKLDQHPDIGQNDSIAYFGVDLQFVISLTLISRAVVDTTVKGQKLIGEPNTLLELEKTGEVEKKITPVTGEVRKGRKKHGTNAANS